MLFISRGLTPISWSDPGGGGGGQGVQITSSIVISN